jgi:hypothetical protein
MPGFRILGHWALVGFSNAKNEIMHVPSFEIEREQSQPARLRLIQPPQLQLNQAPASGGGDGFSTADDVHLGEDRFYMRFHCAFADE